MDNCDFSFRGETLSSHGYVLCEFSGQASASPVTTDSQRSFSQMSMFGGKRAPILFYTYDTSLIIRIEICKKSDTDMIITPSEAAVMKRWLEAPYQEELRFSDSDLAGYFWKGTFVVEELRSYGECVGLGLTFTADAPFGYKDKVIITGTVEDGGSVTILDSSDEEGYIVPDISLTLESSGDLRITNSFDGRTTIVTGCSAGESITMTGLLQILSSNDSRNVGDSFNYKFVRISNNYSDNNNTLTFNLACSYSISYEPIGKVTFS